MKANNLVYLDDKLFRQQLDDECELEYFTAEYVMDWYVPPLGVNIVRWTNLMEYAS